MPLELTDAAATLDGVAEVGDAEALLAWIAAHPDGVVDVGRCGHAHTAVLQVLLATGARLVGADPADAAERPWLAALPRDAADPGGAGR